MRSNIQRDLRFGRRTRTLFTSGLLILSSACGFAQPAPERQACAAGEARGIVGQPYSPELAEKARRTTGAREVQKIEPGVPTRPTSIPIGWTSRWTVPGS
jgi:hypothetical protein